MRNNLCENLKHLRKKNKFTQEDIAKKIGLTKSAYGYYEQGKTVPDAYTLGKLADIFDVSSDFLLGRNTKSSKIDKISNDVKPLLLQLKLTLKQATNIQEEIEKLLDNLY